MWVMVLVLASISILIGAFIPSYFAIILGVILLIMAIWNISKNSKIKQEEQKTRQIEAQYIASQLSIVERGELPVVTNSPIFLAPGETAHLFLRAYRTITKNRMVGRTGGYGGVSVRVAPGVSVHSGKTGSKAIYGDVTDTFEGNVVITNQRLVFINSQKGFECKLKDISAMTEDGRASVDIQTSKGTYSMIVTSPALLTGVLRILHYQNQNGRVQLES